MKFFSLYIRQILHGVIFQNSSQRIVHIRKPNVAFQFVGIDFAEFTTRYERARCKVDVRLSFNAISNILVVEDEIIQD
jgi:hypothetical protein